jgi:uncharacterized Ntn-hydrolase superfamily protein
MWSAQGTLGVYATATGPDCVAAANLLATEDVPLEMVGAFAERPDADLGDRLLAGLAAGITAGGEAGPVHSAGLLIAWDVPWPVTDLRVDWSDDPVQDLTALWRLWRPQAADYPAACARSRCCASYRGSGRRVIVIQPGNEPAISSLTG